MKNELNPSAPPHVAGSAVLRKAVGRQIVCFPASILGTCLKSRLRRVEYGSEFRLQAVAVRFRLNRNDAVENGERMRPACCRRRRAAGVVLTNLPTVWWRTAVGEKFAARRRKPHARGVCSPFFTTSFRLRGRPVRSQDRKTASRRRTDESIAAAGRNRARPKRDRPTGAAGKR